MELKKLADFISPQEFSEMGIAKLTDREQEAILKWGVRQFSLGQHVFGAIDEIKYDGRVVVLDDGSRWEVASYDDSVADLWSPSDEVVVIDGKMYNLADSESIDVTEDE